MALTILGWPVAKGTTLGYLLSPTQTHCYICSTVTFTFTYLTHFVLELEVKCPEPETEITTQLPLLASC
jgi:hypothetical protein